MFFRKGFAFREMYLFTFLDEIGIALYIIVENTATHLSQL